MNEAPIGGFADIEPTAVRTLPRVAIRIFWLVHRAGYRLSGGRLGLARPEAGTKFGLMRLTTLGRRSRQPRVAIIGYYEDGPNLVTLAMNGWGRVDPAWWLNLQATPEATVELVGGPRSVRARIASGDERERLWAKFVDYPGWGDDLDGLAARRPSPTAVVVLEPQDARPGSDADVTDALDSPATASGPQGAGGGCLQAGHRSPASSPAPTPLAPPRHRPRAVREYAGIAARCRTGSAPGVRNRSGPATVRRAASAGDAHGP